MLPSIAAFYNLELKGTSTMFGVVPFFEHTIDKWIYGLFVAK